MSPESALGNGKLLADQRERSFTWHPRTRELWFTDNGRDWLGDDRPPDELNRAPRPGLHFGFPFCHGASLPDP